MFHVQKTMTFSDICLAFSGKVVLWYLFFKRSAMNVSEAVTSFLREYLDYKLIFLVI